MTTAAAIPLTPRPSVRSILAAPFRASTGLGLLHLLLSLPLGILWFTMITTLASLGLGTLVTLVGIPVLGLLGVLILAAARLERARAGLLLAARVEDPHRRLGGLPLGRRILARLAEPALWRDVLYLLLRLPVGILTFTLAITLVAVPLSLLTAPIVVPLTPGTVRVFSRVLDSPAELAAAALAGLVLLWPAAWAIRGLAHLERLLASALLGASATELSARVDELRGASARAADADSAQRRRLERDLHDGAQQRLVKLSMDLGMALERMKADPASAEDLVREAHAEAKRAMAELRDLARGVYPSILAERGLDAALSSLAARCPVPVDVSVAADPRPSSAAESAACFTIAEALANVAKHARATQAAVRVTRDGSMLRVEVSDDGAGGARMLPGGGLAGLSDRVAALGGRLSVDSPAGGPTRVVAEIPCG